MAYLITSQSHLDDDIIQTKRAAKDYTVFLSPVFSHAGDEFQVIMDGHHSLAAAMLDGVEADFDVQDSSQNDTIAWLERGDVEAFLEHAYNDTDYHVFDMRKIEDGAQTPAW